MLGNKLHKSYFFIVMAILLFVQSVANVHAVSHVEVEHPEVEHTEFCDLCVVADKLDDFLVSKTNIENGFIQALTISYYAFSHLHKLSHYRHSRAPPGLAS